MRETHRYTICARNAVSVRRTALMTHIEKLWVKDSVGQFSHIPWTLVRVCERKGREKPVFRFVVNPVDKASLPSDT